MNSLFSLFFAAGVAGFAYTKLGRRVGYGNTQNVFVICAVIFVLAFIVFWTLLTYILHVS